MDEAIKAIDGIFSVARSEYTWGGEEDEYGNLQNGDPDLGRMQKSVNNVIKLLADGGQ